MDEKGLSAGVSVLNFVISVIQDFALQHHQSFLVMACPHFWVLIKGGRLLVAQCFNWIQLSRFPGWEIAETKTDNC